MAKPGRPMCPSIPDVLTDYAHEHCLSMREMCLRIGRSENWINGMFKGDQAQLKPYGILADYAGKKIDELVALIRHHQMNLFINSLKTALEKETKQEESITSLARRIGVSEGFLRKLSKDTGELKGLNSYVELAEAYGFKVDDLRKPVSSQQKIAS